MPATALPPIPTGFTRTVAERAFTCREHGRDVPVRVEFGEPRRDVAVVNGTDWRCPLRLSVGGTVTLRQAMGVDSLQALQLAFEVARAELAALAGRDGVELHYLDEPVDTSRQGWERGLA
ncbi:hypothetical protein FZO89_04120 [Luteimonas viscosa]|uniref:DUF6968 domain-containing protein n=1 Tax=Luteimonas viscosa TaxID=1132694 RepID=A0A5D4XN17_9GAMM|nr:hypothetical protein [Luteimonas viscosa]TYT25514.1 hypothetical protein FZO89_04120 [Luteimonas viscosa]